ncbi:CPBP family intramembrane glutamic endopeptidase [Lentibacillus sp. L22]|uniref:CPBP family intramembrane glutamic endopeptidase n=1 Tax=Lentibacillus TaxID=175304 RepID=UPI0022B136BC|nr:CPBP family intramembrane glutamic endopeptidase [Lentibacillus daqui]
MPSQREILNQLTDRELTKQLLFSQGLLLFLGILLSLILFDHPAQWLHLFRFNGFEIVYYGVFPGLIVVAVDAVLMYVLPERYYDDGGINERIFANRSVMGIIGLVLLIAIAEEVLFRGVLQTTMGYVIASTVFALVHIRYLKKPVLLVSVLLVSFYLGYMFKLTGNLFTTMTAHFIIDFLSGLLIRLKKRCMR